MYCHELNAVVHSSTSSASQGVHPERRLGVTSGTPFESLATSIRLMRRQLADRLGSEGLAITDFWALTAIRQGITSPTALGRNLAITPAGMTQLLDRLETRRFLARKRDPTDRRATVVGLTSRGREAQRRAQVCCTDFLSAVASELTPGGRTALQRLSRELDVALTRPSLRDPHGR